MSTVITTTAMNMAEAQKRAGYTTLQGVLAEMAKTNDLLKVVPFLPASHGTVHKFLKAKKLGKGGAMILNKGISNINSQADPETIEIFGKDAEFFIDKRVLENLTPEAKQKAWISEVQMNAEGFLQDMMDALVYGDTTAKIKGLADYRKSGDYVFKAGGSTANGCTSAYLIEFGDYGVNLRYPTASVPGMKLEDKGEQRIQDGNNGGIYALAEYIAMEAAWQIYNDKCCLRMCNIDASHPFDLKKAITMKNTLPHAGRNAVWLVNGTVQSQVECALLDKSNIYYTRDQVEGFGTMLHIAGIPVIRMDALKDTEAVIS